jgi:hypothetical protein
MNSDEKSPGEKIALTLTPFGQGGLPGGRALKNQPVADFSEGARLQGWQALKNQPVADFSEGARLQGWQ